MTSFDIGQHPGCRAASEGHGVFPLHFMTWLSVCQLPPWRKEAHSFLFLPLRWFQYMPFLSKYLSPFLPGLNLHWFLSGLFSLLNHKGLSKVNGAYCNSQQLKASRGRIFRRCLRSWSTNRCSWEYVSVDGDLTTDLPMFSFKYTTFLFWLILKLFFSQ